MVSRLVVSLLLLLMAIMSVLLLRLERREEAATSRVLLKIGTIKAELALFGLR
jgi:hypothetical protein